MINDVLRRPAFWILALIVAVSLLAPLLATHHPRRTRLDESLQPPSPDHLLGTDLLGRDTFSRLLYGGRQTLAMAAGATLIAAGLGTGIGLLALIGRGADWLVSVGLDALLAIPPLLIALVIVTLIGQGSGRVMIAIGLASTGAFARTTRDALQAQRGMPYVESAISIGAPPRRILIHYLLRNALPILATFTAITFSWVLLNGAALAFLGLTGDPRMPDWGVMLATGRQIVAVAPWEALSAGIMLTLTVGAVNRLGG